MSQELSRAEVKEIWQTVCAQLELELSPGVFSTWILPSPLTSVELTHNKAKVTLSSPSGFLSTNLNSKFGAYLKRVLTSVIDQPVEINYQVGNPADRAQQRPSSPFQTNSALDPTPAHSHRSFATNQQRPSLDSGSTKSPRVEDLFSQSSVAAAEKNQGLARAKNIGLRLDYTFETFAVSSSNEMAHAAATAVSKNPGVAYNPLFLYGGVGVGKTHLMHAIGYNILQHQPTAKIIYCTGEEFTNQIVGAIRNKSTIGFKDRFRNTDILLLDDVQFIAGKDSVQEEFFHTFNALTKNQKQIILTSDRPPHEILLLENRLRSRLEAGLMVDIQQPSFELRTAILLIKSKALHLQLDIEMAKTIAAKVDSARKIEGILNSLRSSIELKGQELNPELIEHTLIEEADQKRPLLNAQIQDVIKTVANHYRLKQQAIKGKSRKKRLVRARHVAMYVCKEYLHEPYAEIGRWFSDRDHSSVLHAYHKINDLLEEDGVIQQEVSAIKMSLSGMR